MTRHERMVGCLIVVAILVGTAPRVDAHGLIGKRFLPATLATEDPFVADELSLPTIFHIKMPGSGERAATRHTDLRGELSKRLTPDLGLSLSGTFKLLDPVDGKSVSGFDNLGVALKYVVWKHAEHEWLLSLGLDWDVGGTGSKKVGAESFDTVTPSFFFGKGLGDLPDALEWLKPLAVTGVFGVALPTRNSNKTVTVSPDGDVEVERDVNPNVARWGFAVQYSLHYLQSSVRDVGLPAPFNRLISIVELAVQTPLDSREAGRTTGTINPGFIWFGRYFQLGIEAVVPVNSRTGKNVGILGQIHFFLDDIAPKIFTWTPFHGELRPAVPR